MAQVRLVSYSPDPERLITTAARQTRSREDSTEIYRSMDEDGVKRMINLLRGRGHLSPFEHVSFTFLVSEISRACSHQLVRHRLASYSQQSQRSIEVLEDNFVVPPSVLENHEAHKKFRKALVEVVDAYNKLLSLGIPLEDARFIVPQASMTKILVTMNARELLHFFSLRLCLKAQWEIREVAEMMLKEAKKVAPNIFDKVGPRCWTLNMCPERDQECFEEMMRVRNLQ
jgi:thymidylate synthase (FAD)